MLLHQLQTQYFIQRRVYVELERRTSNRDAAHGSTLVVPYAA
jgi:hypothetical protein